jgi:hypothetical protein
LALTSGLLAVFIPLGLPLVLMNRKARGSDGPLPYSESEWGWIATAAGALVLPSLLVAALGLTGSIHVGGHSTRSVSSASAARRRTSVPMTSAVSAQPGNKLKSIKQPSGPNHGPVVLAMTLIAIVSAALIFLSGLIDWFYVRPHLRGTMGSVCTTSFESRWRSVTRIWLMHRAAATLGPIAGVTAIIALTANTWIRPIDEVVAGAIAAVATIIAGYYITRTAPLLAIAINPPVQVGDVIEIAEEFNVYKPGVLREYFVVDVALEGVKLLRVGRNDAVRRTGRDADRTHDRTIDVTDIAKLLRGRRPVQPCPQACQKLTEQCACATPYHPPSKEHEQKTASEADSSDGQEAAA